MLYDIAYFSAQLHNMGFNHVADNVDPFTLLSVPKGETAKFFNSMRAAGEMRAAGKRPVIPMEYDPSSPGSGKIGMEALTTQNMENELMAMLGELDKQVSRLGVNLDDADFGPDVTAHQIVAENESQNNFVKQIQEYNASEYEFAVETAMDMIVKLTSSRDSTPLNLTETLETPDGTEIQSDAITLGAVRDELKKHNYFVVINARTGAQPSNTLEQAQIEKLLPIVAPGSPAQNKLLITYSQLNGRNLTPKDFAPPAPQAPPGGPPNVNPSEGPPPEASGTPSETDKLNVTPGQAPVPAFS